MVFGLVAAGRLAAPIRAEATKSDDYAGRDPRLILPNAAGAGTDAVTRLIARHLAARLGRSVSSRTGARTAIGTQAVAKATQRERQEFVRRTVSAAGTAMPSPNVDVDKLCTTPKFPSLPLR